jgi:hypothetical protein
VENHSLSDVGGASGGLDQFLFGFAMASVGGFLITHQRRGEALGRSHGAAPGMSVRNNNRLENQTSSCLELPSLVLVTRSADYGQTFPSR